MKGQQANKTVGIILPTYQEEKSINKMISEIYRAIPDAIIMVVDDSPDNRTSEATREVFDQIIKLGFNPKNALIEKRVGKSGRASAIRHGMRKLYDLGIDFIIEMDTDLSHPPAQLKELYRIILSEETDLVICSRDLKGSKIEGWSFKRHLLHFAANFSCRQLLRLGLRDYMNAYRMYSRKAANIALNEGGKISTGFWGFGEVIANIKLRSDCAIKEIPTHFIDRVKGESMVKPQVIFSCIAELLLVFMLTLKLRIRKLFL